MFEPGSRSMRVPRTSWVLFVVLIAGCAAPPVVMRNAKGETVRCDPSTASTLGGGYIGSKMSVDSCVEQYRKAGFRPVQ